jgi:hypothetical protein
MAVADMHEYPLQPVGGGFLQLTEKVLNVRAVV